MNDLLKNILRELNVELPEEFDANFTRKAFFDQPWEKRKLEAGRGTLMIVSGRLRRSPRCRIMGSALVFTSDAAYFNLHNNGGRVPVTPKMRKYFWAMYYQNGGGIKGKTPTARALVWRSLALTRKRQFTIPRRRMIGDHPRVGEIVKQTTQRQIESWAKKVLDPTLERIGKNLNFK